MSDLLLFGVTIPFLLAVLSYAFDILHTIQEGHIGIYTLGGALLDGYTEPGLHISWPFVMSVHQVQVTLQTDQVTNIPCGTASGVLIYFDKIEVVNRLRKELAWQTIKNYTIDYDRTWIFDKIHHEINQFCSKHTLHEVFITKFDTLDESLQKLLQDGCSQWAPGIEVISVRVTKPRLPKQIVDGYEKAESEKAQLLVVREQLRVREIESETVKLLAKITEEQQSEVSKTKQEIELLESAGQRQLEEIEN